MSDLHALVEKLLVKSLKQFVNMPSISKDDFRRSTSGMQVVLGILLHLLYFYLTSLFILLALLLALLQALLMAAVKLYKLIQEQGSKTIFNKIFNKIFKFIFLIGVFIISLFYQRNKTNITQHDIDRQKSLIQNETNTSEELENNPMTEPKPEEQKSYSETVKVIQRTLKKELPTKVIQHFIQSAKSLSNSPLNQNKSKQKVTEIIVQTIAAQIMPNKPQMLQSIAKIALDQNKAKQLLKQLSTEIQILSNKFSNESSFLMSMKKYTKFMLDIIKALPNCPQSIKIQLEMMIVKINIVLQQLKSQKLSTDKHIDLEITIEIVIVIDITGSMGSMLSAAVQKSKELLYMIRRSYQKARIRYGVVGYRDHCDTELLQSLSLTSNMQEVEKFLDALSVSGGDDYPEAVHDGLMAVNKMGWTPSSFKYVFLICDAPPHGKQYKEFEGLYSDNHQNGCPCGITLNAISNYYKSNKIYLSLMEYGTNLKKVKQLFSQSFGQIFSHGTIDNASFSQKINRDFQKITKQEKKNRVKEFQIEYEQLIQKIIVKVKMEVEITRKQIEVVGKNISVKVETQKLLLSLQKAVEVVNVWSKRSSGILRNH